MRAVLDVVAGPRHLHLPAHCHGHRELAGGVQCHHTRNEFVRMIWDFLYRITEPALRPIRQRVPMMGGIDISPIVLFLLLYFIKLVIVYYIRPYVF